MYKSNNEEVTRKYMSSFISFWRVFILVSIVAVTSMIIVFDQAEIPFVVKFVVTFWFVLWLLYQGVLIWMLGVNKVGKVNEKGGGSNGG